MKTAVLFLTLLIVVAITTAPHLVHSEETPASSRSPFGAIGRMPPNPTECQNLIVFMHGLGDTGTSTKGWLSMFAEFVFPKRPETCVILPTARQMHVRVAQKATTAWFDVSDAKFRDVKQEVDVDEVQASSDYILQLTKDHMKKFDIPWNRVVFAGFSMGAAIAVDAGLRAPKTPAGIISIGGFLAAQSKLLGLGVMKLLKMDTPVIFIHSDSDRVVPIAHADHAVKQLKKVGVKKVELLRDEKSDMGHGLNDEMFEVVKETIDGWLAKAENSDL